MPRRIAPQLARATPEPPGGTGWVHEIKHDGHRIIVYLERGRVRLEARAGIDATRRFPRVPELLSALQRRPGWRGGAGCAGVAAAVHRAERRNRLLDAMQRHGQGLGRLLHARCCWLSRAHPGA
jgi:hypothetical protein